MVNYWEKTQQKQPQNKPCCLDSDDPRGEGNNKPRQTAFWEPCCVPSTVVMAAPGARPASCRMGKIPPQPLGLLGRSWAAALPWFCDVWFSKPQNHDVLPVLTLCTPMNPGALSGSSPHLCRPWEHKPTGVVVRMTLIIHGNYLFCR